LLAKGEIYPQAFESSPTAEYSLEFPRGNRRYNNEEKYIYSTKKELESSLSIDSMSSKIVDYF